MIVALNHSFLVLAIPGYANVWGQNYFQFFDLQSKVQQFLMILGNGGAAVSLFFVMSGFVISLSMEKFVFTFKNYLLYLLKRIFRLYPVYLFIVTSITLAVWMGFDYRTFTPASTWYHWWMNFRLDLVEYIKNALFIHINLGGVTWTLRVIVLATPILPFMYLITKKLNNFQTIIAWLLLIYLSYNQLNIDGFRDFRYLHMFFLGLILPKFTSQFSKIKPTFFIFSLPILLTLLFTIRYQTDEYFGGIIESVICFAIMGVILYQPKVKVFDFLDNSFFVYLGRISYSLYLVHFSILYALARVLLQFMPNLPYQEYYLFFHTVLFFISTALSIPVSHILNRYVETPPVTYLKSRLLEK